MPAVSLAAEAFVAAVAKEKAGKAVLSPPQPSVDAAFQATITQTLTVNAAVQSVALTVDEAVQASKQLSQGIRVHAEQARQPLQEDHLLQHRLKDLLCRHAFSCYEP